MSDNEQVEVIEADGGEEISSSPRDLLSVALIAAIGGLILLCVVFVLIANSHRPAGL